VAGRAAELRLRGRPPTHGATSERQIRPRAANHRRRVLRQLRLRAGDLDAVGLAYLDSYVRLIAKVDLVDTFLDENPMIRADGSLQPCMALYVSLVNSSRLALVRLEDHLRGRQLGPDPLVLLEGVGREILERRDREERA
jgi:hypothetical protein